jgi:hypothetical protein
MKEKLIIALLLVAMLAGVLVSGYQIGKRDGVKLGEEKYTEWVNRQVEATNQQVEANNLALEKLSKDLELALNGISTEGNRLRQQLKNSPQPMLVLRDNNCYASDEVVKVRKQHLEKTK